MDLEYNEEDLINDYIEQHDEGPSNGYDEYYESMIAEHATQTTSVTAASVEIVAPALLPPNVDSDEVELLVSQSTTDRMDIDAVPTRENRPATTRNIVTLPPGRSGNLYSFDRYSQSGHQWRREATSALSNVIEAQSWKRVSPDQIDTESSPTPLSTYKYTSINPITTTRAADAQLLQFLQYKQPDTYHMSRRSMSIKPIIGKPSMTIQLTDGTRRYIAQRQPESFSIKENKTQNPLGVPVSELMERVNTMRRRQEHARRLHLGSDEVAQKHKIDSCLWVDKYAPTSFLHLLSDERINREVLRAVRLWDPYVFNREVPQRVEWDNQQSGQQKQDTQQYSKFQKNVKKSGSDKCSDSRPDEASRVVLLSGPPGVGKTTLAHIVARQAGYRPLEVNGSDERSTAVLTEKVIRVMESTSLNMSKNDKSRPNCLILDEIDGADAKGAVAALVRIIRAEKPEKGSKDRQPFLRRPIIFVCNNKYAPTLKLLLPYCVQFDVRSPSPLRLVARLKSILTSEKATLPKGALLNQLVEASCGDIRACLNTLQYVCTQTRELIDDSSVAFVDISTALNSTLNGSGLKDERSDVAGTVACIFQKRKKKQIFGRGVVLEKQDSATRVLELVNSLNDTSRILDSIFMNVLHVSYIDPTLDRCSAVHDILSSSDLLRSQNSALASNDSGAQHTLFNWYASATAGAAHVLCRIENPTDLTFSAKEFYEKRYQHEENDALLQKFTEGLSLGSLPSLSRSRVSLDAISYILWILSAGEGSCSLSRATSSVEILSQSEKQLFDVHADILGRLGLTYKLKEHDHNDAYGSSSLVLDPPLHRFVQFTDLVRMHDQVRHEIPATLKELLSAKVIQNKVFRHDSGKSNAGSNRVLPVAKSTDSQSKALPKNDTKKRKQSQGFDFLQAGAKKAKELRSARTAARAGMKLSSRTQKISHTGSKVPLCSVIRLKFVKGFTQAVRAPCKIEDLM